LWPEYERVKKTLTEGEKPRGAENNGL